ncbi:MAG TPA: hypothetical protein VGC67_11145 [Cellulomonas sp.]
MAGAAEPVGSGDAGASASGAANGGGAAGAAGAAGVRIGPTWRRGTWSVRRSLLLLVGSGLAVLGVLTLVVVWFSLVTGSLSAGIADGGGCVDAATAGTDGAQITTSLLPPRSVCRWEVAGEPVETVLATGSSVLVDGAVVAAAAGVLVVGGTALAARRGLL